MIRARIARRASRSPRQRQQRRDWQENPDRKRRNLRLPQGLLRFFLVAEHARGPRLLRRAAQEQHSLFRRRRASFERDAWRRLRRARGLRGQARQQGRFQIAIAFAPPRIAAKLHAVTPPASRYAELAARWIFRRRPSTKSTSRRPNTPQSAAENPQISRSQAMLEFPRTAAPLAGRGARALNSLILRLESLRSGLNRKGSRFPYFVVLSGAKPASAFAESALAVGSVDRNVEDRPRFVLGVFWAPRRTWKNQLARRQDASNSPINPAALKQTGHSK